MGARRLVIAILALTLLAAAVSCGGGAGSGGARPSGGKNRDAKPAHTLVAGLRWEVRG